MALGLPGWRASLCIVALLSCSWSSLPLDSGLRNKQSFTAFNTHVTNIKPTTNIFLSVCPCFLRFNLKQVGQYRIYLRLHPNWELPADSRDTNYSLSGMLKVRKIVQLVIQYQMVSPENKRTSNIIDTEQDIYVYVFCLGMSTYIHMNATTINEKRSH